MKGKTKALKALDSAQGFMANAESHCAAMMRANTSKAQERAGEKYDKAMERANKKLEELRNIIKEA